MFAAPFNHQNLSITGHAPEPEPAVAVAVAEPGRSPLPG